MPDVADAAVRPRRLPVWVAAVLPLALLAGFLLIVTRANPADVLMRDRSGAPAVYLSIQKVIVTPTGFVATVMNESAEPATIAQVIVDDAFWTFTSGGNLRMPPLGTVTLTIPYPWVPGESHRIDVLTSTGARYGTDVTGESTTPVGEPRYLKTFAAIGIVVGLVPVAIGLCWLPLVAGLGRRASEALLAFTAGVVLFLFVDALRAAIRGTHMMAIAYQGLTLFVMGAAAAFVALVAFGVWRRRRGQAGDADAWTLAMILAIGIGLTNLTQGVSIGMDLVVGEFALRSRAIIGISLHNVLQGIAIASLLWGVRVTPAGFLAVVLLAGAPAVAGLLMGGILQASPLSIVLVGVGAGAVAAVVPGIAGRIAPRGVFDERFATARVLLSGLSGLAAMYAAGLLIT